MLRGVALPSRRAALHLMASASWSMPLALASRHWPPGTRLHGSGLPALASGIRLLTLASWHSPLAFASWHWPPGTGLLALASGIHLLALASGIRLLALASWHGPPGTRLRPGTYGESSNTRPALLPPATIQIIHLDRLSFGASQPHFMTAFNLRYHSTKPRRQLLPVFVSQLHALHVTSTSHLIARPLASPDSIINRSSTLLLGSRAKSFTPP